MKNSKTVALVTLVALSVLTIAIAVRKVIAARPVNASTVEVKIDNFTFSPTSLTVRAGTQITWTNHDDIPHTVVENGKSFRSRVLDTDEKFTFIASNPGTYRYYCSIHPKMTAQVIVK